jgi:hypothetical protein
MRDISNQHFHATQAVPVGTPNFVGAAGTVQTCTAQGFINLMFNYVVPVYYASLSIYSFLAVKNNFRQEEYIWIEKWIHAVAYIVPLTLCLIVLVKDSFNPRGTGCSIAASPLGCERDPAVQCVRGGILSDVLIVVLAFGNVVIYLIIPPMAMVLMGCWIKRTSKDAETSEGLRQLQISARKQMMQDVRKQISLYLISFWITYICPLANAVIEKATGSPDTTLLIVGNCLSALQGCIVTMVYFTLQRMSNASMQLNALACADDVVERRKKHLTVSKIRTTVESKDQAMVDNHEEVPQGASFIFSIFDGTPTDDSPWAKYIDQDDFDDNESAGFESPDIQSSEH